MKALAIIPARLGSTRLPRKILRRIADRPMLAHVYQAAAGFLGPESVLVATDSQEVLELCEQNGWRACMTSAEHRSGTDRLHEVACSIHADFYVNVQGDEPLARAEHIAALFKLMQEPGVEVGTLKTPCAQEEWPNPNVVKVVTDNAGRALYFSRSTIPFDRDGGGNIRIFKHLGFYAYRRAALDAFRSLGESVLERTERLEQLRFLENGIHIHVSETPFDTIGVDTEEDLRRVEAIIQSRC